MFQRNAAFFEQHRIPGSMHPEINMNFIKQILDCHNYTLYSDSIKVLSSCLKMGYINYILSNNFPELPQIRLSDKKRDIIDTNSADFLESNMGG